MADKKRRTAGDDPSVEKAEANPAPVEPVEPAPAPVAPPVEPEKATTMDDHGIGAGDPYPTGNAPASSDAGPNVNPKE